MRENLRVILDEFSTLSLAVFLASVITWHRQAHLHKGGKLCLGLCPVSLRLPTPFTSPALLEGVSNYSHNFLYYSPL
jgi:hypothetical protein